VSSLLSLLEATGLETNHHDSGERRVAQNFPFMNLGFVEGIERGVWPYM